MSAPDYSIDNDLIPADILYAADSKLYGTYYPIKLELEGTTYGDDIRTATSGFGGYCHYIVDGTEVVVLHNDNISHEQHINHWFANGATLVTIIERTIVEGRAPERYAGRYMPTGKPTVKFTTETAPENKDVLVFTSASAKVVALNCATCIGVINDISTPEEWELINSAALKMGKAVGFNNSGDVPFPKGVPVASYTYQYTIDK